LVLAVSSDIAGHIGAIRLSATPKELLSMTSRRDTSPTRAKQGDLPTSSVPARSDIGENSASEVIEAPQKAKRNPLDPHDFADGGGGGGAEAFSRSRVKKPRLGR
jgi:hypothetical protein